MAAGSMKRAVVSFSRSIFPDMPSYQEMAGSAEDVAETGPLIVGEQVLSSLPLQIALYFNAFFFPCWLVTMVTMLRLKYDCLSNLYQFILVILLVAVCLIEVVRLYLGYLGNITEKVPELAAFWLLSLLLQLPMQGFLLLNEAALLLPMERAVNIVMSLFILAELVIGYSALRQVTRYQAKRLHLQQLKKFLAASDAQRGMSA